MTARADGLLPPAAVRTLLDLRADPDAAVRRAAAVALARLPLGVEAAAAAGVPSAAAGRYLPPEPGVVAVSPEAVDRLLSGPPVAVRSAPLPPELVTAAVRRLADAPPEGAAAGARALRERVAAHPGRFRPDLAGLAAVHRGLLDREGPPDRRVAGVLTEVTVATRLRHDVAWLVSRGGPRAVLAGLDDAFRSADRDERLAAVCLVAEAAPMFDTRPDRREADTGVFRADFLTEPEARDAPVGDLPWSLPAPARVADDDVQFTVFRPGTVRPEAWHSLLAFAHRTEEFTTPDGVRVDPVAEVERQAAAQLGPQMREFARVGVDSAVGLPRGDEIVFEPWLAVGEVNPARAAVRWEEPVHRADFRIRFPRHVDGQRVRGGLRVYLGVVLLAQVDFAVRVRGDTAGTDDVAPVAARPYRRIFASYSHRDAEIVHRIADLVAITGDRYLIDSRELRSGQRWGPELADMITTADVFQLFWSRNAMASPFVRQEWEHALAQRREGFIRPVYWEDPFPEDPRTGLPPTDLRRYHFSRLRPDVAGAERPCPTCGYTPSVPGTSFCARCGAWLDPAPAPGAARPPVAPAPPAAASPPTAAAPSAPRPPAAAAPSAPRSAPAPRAPAPAPSRPVVPPLSAGRPGGPPPPAGAPPPAPGWWQSESPSYRPPPQSPAYRSQAPDLQYGPPPQSPAPSARRRYGVWIVLAVLAVLVLAALVAALAVVLR